MYTDGWYVTNYMLTLRKSDEKMGGGGSTIFVRMPLNTTEDNIAYHSKIKPIGLHMSLLPLKRMD